MEDLRYPHLVSRLQTTLDRLERTRNMIREDGLDEDLHECVTDAAASADAALAIARGDEDAIREAMEVRDHS